MAPESLGDFCRQVEQHLTRVNGGHLVRIAGPAFEVVRRWADDGIPMSVVFRGIEQKAERHRLGTSRRPLRIEFCDDDVRELFDAWRRATGLSGVPGAPEGAAGTPDTGGDAVVGEATRPAASLSKALARAVDRLSRAAGRLELPDALRDVLGGALAELTELRDAARAARGAARAGLADRVADFDRRFTRDVRAAVPAGARDAAAAAAAIELAPYRERLSPEAWQQAVDATVDRLLRDRFNLPEGVGSVGHT